MQDDKHEIITDDELLEALAEVRNDIHDGPLKRLLGLVVDRLIETSTVFNEHEHGVHGVTTESSDYYSAGEGRTGTPSSAGAYNCEKDQRIGIKPHI